MKLPELLLPAGSFEKAVAAITYGADAVYAGSPSFSLRTRENRVTENDLEKIIAFAHARGKKVYATVNAFPHEFLIPHLKKHLEFLAEKNPDGIIFADLGVLALANEIAPKIPKHLSVQTSTTNIPAMKLWQKLGVSRVILARETAIKEVAKIHAALPDLELEYFVHGAVCMAYSGRCLLSNFSAGRNANAGACNHACRWNYKIFDEDGREIDLADHEISDKKGGKSKSIRDFEKLNFLEEEKRRGEIIPVEEDFHGTHIMSSRDMCMIEHLREIADAGVVSLKVEGRNKSAYYAATVARAYRGALDDLAAGRDFNEKWGDEIHATANRGFFPGFLHGRPRSGDIKYSANSSTAQKEFAGVVQKFQKNRVEILVKNQIVAGEKLEFLLPNPADDFEIVAEDLRFGDEKVEVLHGGNTNKTASLKCDRKVPAGTFFRQKVKNAGLKKSPAEIAAESYRA